MTHVDAALLGFTHAGNNYESTIQTLYFDTPDPVGSLLVYDGLLIFTYQGTATTGFFPYQYTDASLDGLYLITNDEFTTLMGDAAIIHNLAVQFNTMSFTVPPGSFQL